MTNKITPWYIIYHMPYQTPVVWTFLPVQSTDNRFHVNYPVVRCQSEASGLCCGGLDKSPLTQSGSHSLWYLGRHSRYVHQNMMTSSNGNIFRVTGHLRGNSPVTGEFPAQRPVTRSFDVFCDLRLNKQWWNWLFKTPARPLWRHRNECIEFH